MMDLRQQLQQCLRGRFCLMGLGNVDYGDDGFGVRLAEKLEEAGMPGVIIVGASPERFIGKVIDDGYDNLLFLDAVDFGGAPGSAIFLDAAEITARFPQVSTHKISLGLMAKWVEDSGKTRVYLLGVQPESLKAAEELTPAVGETLELLSGLFDELLQEEKKSDESSMCSKELSNGRTEATAPTNEVTV